MSTYYRTLRISFIICLFFINTVKPEDYQAAPVIFTTSGLIDFFQNTYNHIEYKDIIANNFFHMIQFLDHYGKYPQQPRLLLKSVIRLFCNALKRSSYINAHAFTQLLHKLPILLNGHLISTVFTSEQKETRIYELLYRTFEKRWDDFKNDSILFLHNVSKEIIRSLYEPQLPTDDCSVEDLQKMIFVFLEISINKLIWNPHDKELTWKSVTAIADILETLTTHHIIADQDELNDLYISLIHRYCLFLDLVNTELPLEFYQKMKTTLQTPCKLLDLAEQEEYIRSKIDYLRYTLLSGEAHAIAQEQSLINQVTNTITVTES